MNPQLRILRLVGDLLDSDRGLTPQEMAARGKCSLRTVYNDLQVLRAAGYELHSRPRDEEAPHEGVLWSMVFS